MLTQALQTEIQCHPNKVTVPSYDTALQQCFPNLTVHWHLPESSLKQSAVPIPGISNSVGLWWGPNIGIANRILGDSEAAGTGPHFEKHCAGETLKHVNTNLCT